ncbi:JACALIN-RELATED LECTIN 3 [Salix purpurea]|uniref:JACALIN-RELATED LECTIN 3 n=1 Tax=Salix purpurea TaxID=77065 RepID=A0A9Q0PB47_SALPP|nr:JACALIN-RELATED LECTIN 3 [Salix purpurea]
MSSEDGEMKPVAAGPWGGQEGFPWDDGVHSTVKQLVIAHGAGIESIQVEYDRKGTSIWSQIHGGNGGMKTTVKLDCPDEFLTSVHGYYGSLDGWGPVFVRSLTFQSNKKTYGPFGVEQGTYFSFPTSGGKIVGFHGKSGWYLDAIGIYLKPIQNQKTSKSLVQSRNYITNGTDNISYTMMQGAGNGFDVFVAVKQKEDIGKFSLQISPEDDSGGTNRKDDFGSSLPSKLYRQVSRESSDSESSKKDDFSGLSSGKLSKQISRELSDAGTKWKTIATERVPSKTERVIVYGPWGGVGGSKFDDGTYTGIRQIHLSRHVGIASIRVQYDRDGQAIWGSKHGGSGGFKSDKIIFDYPYEILTRVTGTYGPLMYMGPNVIKSLTFYTNKGKHGPFGEEQGPSFANKIDEGKIIGFHGREGFLLDAIGAHVLEGTVKPAKHHLSDAIKHSEADVAEIDNSPWSNKLVAARPGQTEEVTRNHLNFT